MKQKMCCWLAKGDLGQQQRVQVGSWAPFKFDIVVQFYTKAQERRQTMIGSVCTMGVMSHVLQTIQHNGMVFTMLNAQEKTVMGDTSACGVQV